jgi:hypothetical protein
MNRQVVARLLDEIAKACDDLRSELLCAKSSTTKGKAATPSRVDARRRRKEGPTEWVRGLIDEGFFATPRTDLDAARELKRHARGCARTTVAVALARFVRQHTLAREGNGTKNSPYQYSIPTRRRSPLGKE